MSILARVKQWLFDTWKISVPDDWLSACWEWIREQQQQNSETFESQCGHVFDQWLLSDLNEIGASCFPANLNRHDKYFLQGIFAAQINSMVDISLPMYKQLQKMAGTENENAFVDAATQQTQRQDDIKDKTNRMMMMILSDGSHEIFGIEREHIPSLNHNLTLGTKVIIHGGVLCRKGVLLLKPENLSVLGGEVETLVEQSTSIKIIEDKLRANTERFKSSTGQNSRNQKKEFKNFTILSNTDLSLDSKKYKNSQSNSRHQTRGYSDNKSNIKSEPMSSFNQVQSSSNFKVKVERSTPLPTASNDPFSDDSMDLVFEEAMRRNGIGDGDQLAPPTFGHVTASGPHSMDKTTKNNLFADDDDDLIFEDTNVTWDAPSRNTALPNRPITTKQEVYEDVTTDCKNTTTTTTHYDKGSKRLKLSTSEDKFNHLTINPSTYPTTNPSTYPSTNPSTYPPIYPPTNPSTNPSTYPTTNPSINQIVTPSTSTSRERTHKRPFEYIRNILNGNKCGIYFVKAYVSTVTSRLEHNEGRLWSISARLDDGSSTLDVHFHDKLLTKLIGFSSYQCHDMKKRVKTEPHLKQVILGAIKQFQEALIKLSVIFELHVVPSPPSSSSSQLSSSLSSSQTPLLMMMSLPTPNRDFSYIVMDYRKVTRDDMMAMRQVVNEDP